MSLDMKTVHDDTHWQPHYLHTSLSRIATAGDSIFYMQKVQNYFTYTLYGNFGSEVSVILNVTFDLQDNHNTTMKTWAININIDAG